MTTNQCIRCGKKDVCKYRVNYEIALYRLQKLNTTIEPDCSVPLEDAEFMTASLHCKYYSVDVGVIR